MSRLRANMRRVRMKLGRIYTETEQDTQPGADIAHAEVADEPSKNEACQADPLKPANQDQEHTIQGSQHQQQTIEGLLIPNVVDASQGKCDEIRCAERGLQDAMRQLSEEVDRLLQDKTSSRDSISVVLRQNKPSSFTDIIDAICEREARRQETSTAKVTSLFRNLYPIAKLTAGLAKDIGGGLLPAAGAVGAGLGCLFELLMKPHAQTEVILDLLQRISGSKRLLENLHDVPSRDLDVDVLLAALHLSTALTRFMEGSLVWLDKGALAKFGSVTLTEDRLKASCADITKTRQDLNEAMQNEAFFMAKQSNLEVQQATLLAKICKANEHDFHLAKQDSLRNRRLPGTGTLFLDQESYADFRGGKTRLLWCTGMPGAGKTYIASAIIDDLEVYSRHRDVGLAYVFFERGMEQVQDDDSAIAALTWQLMARKPGLLWKSKQLLGNDRMSNLERKMLFCQACSSFEQIFLVVDALDELSAEAKVLHRLMKHLVSLVVDESPSSRIKICLTSRENPSIWSMVENALSMAKKPAKKVEFRASEDDIRTLVEAEAEQDPGFLFCESQDPPLRYDFVQNVVERSGRMVLRSCIDGSEAVRNCLKYLSDHINDYYVDDIKRIEQRPEEDKRRAFRLLSWVVNTPTPLRSEELAVAMAIECRPPGSGPKWSPVNIDRYIALTEGLLIVNRISRISDLSMGSVEFNGRSSNDIEEIPGRADVDGRGFAPTRKYHVFDHVVTAAHETVLQFLSSKSDTSMYIADGKARLAGICLNFFIDHVDFTRLLEAAPVESLLRSREEFREILEGNLHRLQYRAPGFASWAFCYWGDCYPKGHSERSSHRKRLTGLVNCYSTDEIETPGLHLLHLCAAWNWLSLAEDLLAASTKPDICCCTSSLRSRWMSRFHYSMTPLDFAVLNRQSQMAQLLLTGAHPDFDHHQHHQMLLRLALEHTDAPTSRVLLQKGVVNVNEPSCHTGVTPLGLLLRPLTYLSSSIDEKQRILATMDVVLAHSQLEINAQDVKTGEGAVHFVPRVPGIAALQLLDRLVRAGIDIHQATAFRGTTVLMLSSWLGRADVVARLLELSGSQADAVDACQRTALHYACIPVRYRDSTWGETSNSSEERDNASQYRDCRMVLDLLRQKTLDIDARDSIGRTSLAWACLCTKAKFIGAKRATWEARWTREQLSPDAGIDDLYDHTLPDSDAFQVAVAFLLDAGANPHIVDKAGHSPLDHANAMLDLANKRFACALEVLRTGWDPDILETHLPLSYGAWVALFDHPDTPSVDGIMLDSVDLDLFLPARALRLIIKLLKSKGAQSSNPYAADPSACFGMYPSRRHSLENVFMSNWDG
ncbi:hypothetical protein KC343_g3670 [Hortaea werneckii]|nr:hypothetical protein KC352_g11052 [Hortaea werneckii]KAI7572642.1 hypothetical protein KC317_g569 [Hortaea werneckii]KAI7621120.1 hypothetical protein KC346_g3791 [Hortaea werneckii]KAI7632070.1 hypothetical protein KC343_g3670 [Hortaea werneckii]KAI7677829.1 hypothetical protein KC319_g3684 [Hortaea werneckii]